MQGFAAARCCLCLQCLGSVRYAIVAKVIIAPPPRCFHFKEKKAKEDKPPKEDKKKKETEDKKKENEDKKKKEKEDKKDKEAVSGNTSQGSHTKYSLFLSLTTS